MDTGLERLLELAADTETLQDSLADVDLSAADDEGEAQGEEGDRTAAAAAASKEGRGSTSSNHSAASVLMSPSAAAAASSGGPDVAKTRANGPPTFRNTSWDKEDVGNEDTTEVSLHRLQLCLLVRCQPSATVCAARHLT